VSEDRIFNDDICHRPNASVDIHTASGDGDLEPGDTASDYNTFNTSYMARNRYPLDCAVGRHHSVRWQLAVAQALWMCLHTTYPTTTTTTTSSNSNIDNSSSDDNGGSGNMQGSDRLDDHRPLRRIVYDIAIDAYNQLLSSEDNSCENGNISR
jgi:hypothetical protein